MTLRRASILLLALAPLLVAADKPVLVPDISARNVQIRYSFTGAQLLLFGAVVYPGGRAPQHPADIAVVLRGPVQPILVREKQKIAGIWMNADSNRFRSAPSFYAVASSRPILDLVADVFNLTDRANPRLVSPWWGTETFARVIATAPRRELQLTLDWEV